jgi:tRNA threonylcarbamoyl adenosine modification protein (Sua5/YciO/YrdC/YwlC family)
VCQNFAQLGQFVQVDNDVFRAIKASTPGSYTFILPATKEVPRKLLHPKKKTVGVRIPDHVVAQALLAELGEPLLSSTLLLPDEEEPMTQGWEIKDQLDHVVDAVVDSGDCGTEPTTVIDFSNGEAEIVRKGAGDGTLLPVRVTERPVQRYAHWSSMMVLASAISPVQRIISRALRKGSSRISMSSPSSWRPPPSWVRVEGP